MPQPREEEDTPLIAALRRHAPYNTACEDAIAVLLEQREKLNQTYAEWREARSAELLLVQTERDEARRANRNLLEEYHTLAGRLSAVEAECAAALAELDRARAALHSPDLREALAAYAHDAWSGWMEYLFGKCSYDAATDTWTIPAWAVERWTRQMVTVYDALPEAEKESDRAEADKMLALIVAGRGVGDG